MTSVRLTKLTSLFAALALVFALFCAASTVCAADTEAGTTAAAEAGETEATETEPEATEPAGSGTLTTGTDTEKKDLNWDLIITLGVIGIAVIVLLLLYLFNVKFRERVKKFFREYKSELKKVVWSPARDVKKNTIVVIVVALAFAIAIGILDVVFSRGFSSITNLITGSVSAS